jgi:hypothetical protein
MPRPGLAAGFSWASPRNDVCDTLMALAPCNIDSIQAAVILGVGIGLGIEQKGGQRRVPMPGGSHQCSLPPVVPAVDIDPSCDEFRDSRDTSLVCGNY